MATGVASFNYTVWVARYPEFSGVSSGLAQQYWDEATLYLRNDGSGPVCDVAQRTVLLNMLTAHIAQVYALTAASQPVSTVVGRVSDATEGSVTVGTDNQYPPGTAQWYQQTKYGASFWAATVRWRTMRYVPGNPSGTGPVVALTFPRRTL